MELRAALLGYADSSALIVARRDGGCAGVAGRPADLRRAACREQGILRAGGPACGEACAICAHQALLWPPQPQALPGAADAGLPAIAGLPAWGLVAREPKNLHVPLRVVRAPPSQESRRFCGAACREPINLRGCRDSTCRNARATAMPHCRAACQIAGAPAKQVGLLWFPTDPTDESRYICIASGVEKRGHICRTACQKPGSLPKSQGRLL